MNRKEALIAYGGYNEKIYLTKNKKDFNALSYSNFNEKIFDKAIELLTTIAIKSIGIENNPLIAQTGVIASLLNKAFLESDLNEEMKVNLIYNLELNPSYSHFKYVTYYSEERFNFYEAIESLNDLIKESIDVKQTKELRMLVSNVLKRDL